MKNSHEFLKLILDSMTAHIVVVDQQGVIQYINKSWSTFGTENSCMIKTDWQDINYIDECDRAAALGDTFGKEAAEGIRKVIAETIPVFYLEYPCHAPDEQRWFMMRATPFQLHNVHYCVITHQNITERKLAEEEVKKLARIDGLTQVANRRAFDEFIHQELKRCSRLGKPICLTIIDIDYFKLLNDTYGHQYGDHCLVQVGSALNAFAHRPGDMCARYGGEEFAIVWGDTPLANAYSMTQQILAQITALNIPNADSPIAPYLTVSVGLAELKPGRDSQCDELITLADQMLYKAKENGRNRVEY